MTGALKTKSPTAGTVGGSNIAKQLDSAFGSKNYSRVARSATPVRELVPVIVRTIAEHGLAALEMPKRAAALHEAGHTVVYAVEGERVKSVRIRSGRIGGKLAWGGQTFGGSPWCADPSTDPAADLRRVRLTLAGVVAEATFDEDNFRQGSSLDEIVLGKRLCALAACKLQRSANEVLDAAVSEVRAILIEHEAVVLAIAADLERKEWLRGARLADMIAPLREAVS